MPKILVVDEHSVFREGLCALVESNIPHAEVLPASGLAALIHALGVRNRTEAAFSTATLLDLFKQQPVCNPILAPGSTNQED